MKYNLDFLEVLEISGAATLVNNKIPYAALESHANIHTVNIPSAIIVGENAFAYCRKLVTVILGNVEEVHTQGFRDCDSLFLIWLPKSESLGYEAFRLCDKLASINFQMLLMIWAVRCFMDAPCLNQLICPIWSLLAEGCFYNVQV